MSNTEIVFSRDVTVTGVKTSNSFVTVRGSDWLEPVMAGHDVEVRGESVHADLFVGLRQVLPLPDDGYKYRLTLERVKDEA